MTEATGVSEALVKHPAGILTFTFECEYPPTTNHLFGTVFTGRGKMLRAASKEYQSWRAIAAHACKWLRWPAGNQAHWALTIYLHNFPHTGDVSNRIKAIEDLIVAHTGLDDAWNDDVRAVRRRNSPGGKRAEVEVTVLGWMLEGDE